MRDCKTVYMKAYSIFKRLYVWSTGYSYPNLGRLFLRLFVGIMLIQFAVRQMYNFDTAAEIFPQVAGMSSGTGLTVMIVIEMACSLFVMAGFLTRVMVLPPFVAMIIAEYYLLHDLASVPPYDLSWQNPAYIPVLFLGIYFFLLIVGPGKISVDYFLSLHLIHSADREEDELEVV